MANDKKPRDTKNAFVKAMERLNRSTSATNTQLFGMETNATKLVSDTNDKNIAELSNLSEQDKSVINSHRFKSKIIQAQLDSTISSKKNSSIYDYMQSTNVLSTIDTLVGSENAKFSQMLKDYEIVKRCIPQVHKVISSIKNNIITPDTMTDSAIGVKLPESCNNEDKKQIMNIIKKYDLNRKLSDYVMDYLIVSVHYETVIPYSTIPDMMMSLTKNGNELNRSDGILNESYEYDIDSELLNEGIELIKNSIKHETLLSKSSPIRGSLNESVTFSPYKQTKSSFLNESGGYGIDYEEDPTDYEYQGNKSNLNISPSQLDSALNECLSDIEFVDGGFEYYKRAFLNEAVIRGDEKINSKSIKSTLTDLKSHSARVHSSLSHGKNDNDGMVAIKTVKEIKSKVSFKGCHLETLNPARVIPFKLRNTLIGYYYVEEGALVGNRSENNVLSTIMDKLNSSVYLKNDKENKAKEIEFTVVKKISEKLIEAINAKFINDNYDDLDKIYEFVRVNELWRSNKRVIFFHPDDVCEYRRADGSIMKNCMYLAKLYILTMLSNILTNVTRGSDRNIYYVKTGLTTDIEGHVNSAIRALKQGQIRYSDIGTINEVFNIVGSNVDAFIPISEDGDKPIDIQTEPGQAVNMQTDFLRDLLKSIVQSFGVPSTIIDDFENIDFARTITQSNIDMAKMVMEAQHEILPALTKEIRLIVSYEMPDFDMVDEIEATLNPPSEISDSMNASKLSSLSQISSAISAVAFPPQQESLQEKRIRMFNYEFLKKNIPTINWGQVNDIITEINQKSKAEMLSAELETGDFEPDGLNDNQYN